MAKKSKPENNEPEIFILLLYVSGMSQKSMEAIENITQICDQYLAKRFKLEIIDIYKDPDIARAERIVFSPSLIKMQPLPRKVLIGNFSDTKKALKALGIQFND